MVSYEPAEHVDSDHSEVPGGIVGLGHLVDTAVQPFEGDLGQGRDEAVLRAEHAVDGAGSRIRIVGYSTYGQRVWTALGDEPFSRSEELPARPFIVLSRSAHP